MYQNFFLFKMFSNRQNDSDGTATEARFKRLGIMNRLPEYSSGCHLVRLGLGTGTQAVQACPNWMHSVRKCTQDLAQNCVHPGSTKDLLFSWYLRCRITNSNGSTFALQHGRDFEVIARCCSSGRLSHMSHPMVLISFFSFSESHGSLFWVIQLHSGSGTTSSASSRWLGYLHSKTSVNHSLLK